MKLPNLHRKGHAYYYVTGTKPRKWIPLGSDLPLALKRYERLRGQKPGTVGTIGALIDEWMLSPPRKLSEGTRKVYATYATHIKRVFGNAHPDEVKREAVLSYLDQCRRTTAQHEIMLLRAVMERAVRRGLAESNPCVQAKPEGGIVRPKRDRLITDDELARIREHAAPVLRIAIDLALATALRPGDLCRLRWGELETGVKTRKTGAWLRWDSTDDLRAILDAAKALQARVACLTVLSERGRPVKPRRLGVLWIKACAQAGVVNAQFRDIRAASASARPEDAQERLGHSSPQMTKTYLRGREVKTVKPLKRKGNGPS